MIGPIYRSHLSVPYFDLGQPRLGVGLDGSRALDVAHVLQPELAHLATEVQHLLLLHVQPGTTNTATGNIWEDLQLDEFFSNISG